MTHQDPKKSASPPPAEEEPLQEGRDFYFDPNGLMVLTEAWLKKRGWCCQSGCRHCPWNYRKPVT